MMISTSTTEILVVDDKPANLRLLVEMLGAKGYTVRPVTSGKMALMSIEAAVPDLILLDVDMPEMDGYEVCRRIKRVEALADIPIIFVSALGDTVDKVEGFKAGGVDYVTKPFQIDEVQARIETQLAIYKRQRRIMDERQHLEDAKRKTDEHIQIVTHDVKTQLTAISAALQMIQTGSDLGQKEREYVEVARTATYKVLNKMVQLIDGTNEEEETTQSLSFNDFLIDIYNELLIVSRNMKLDFKLTLPPENTIAVFAPDKMRQVMHNLLSNAFKYTPEGGHVHLHAEVKSNTLVISVEDDGLGIPAEDIPRIFNKFFRVDTDEHRIVEGTGLGLSIVKSLVERHGGNIHVDSRIGEGTTFYFTLPLGN